MEVLADGRTAVMGILNVTPDSFSDGGRYDDKASAVDRARRMVDEGVDVIDVGGESTRPGAREVAVSEEVARTAPVIEQISTLGVRVSIDTRKATVAKAALDAGASLVNDVSAGSFDPAMLPLVADRRVPVILMHMRGTPETMDRLTDYDDVVDEVSGELLARVSAARHAGVEVTNILLDPGLGFAKTSQQSLELLRRLGELRKAGFPFVVGPSRKRFIGGALEERLAGTLAAVAWCAMQDVEMVRVHDVGEARRVVDMITELKR